ncbi:polysaccharide biosynthesis/export family protein [Neptunomonas phycophila]|jgi:polysaccharide export outer membrane protein|uniref:polysaccharide biosynthesis/export family protein n=1 Tax=Neptunomonas phycophila TaxID=1572645 RepID=UPI00351990B4
MIGRFLTLFMVFSFIALPSSWADAEGFSEYRLSAGDRIKINVFGEAELSVETRLSDAGTIPYPFLGEVRALGMTTGELTAYLTDRLLDGYLLDPSVSVNILEYREFFIDGAVKSPGGYPYQPGLTLQRAVSLSGGFTPRASSSKFYVVRESEGGSKPIKIDLNDSIKPGDFVTIEESFF